MREDHKRISKYALSIYTLEKAFLLMSIGAISITVFFSRGIDDVVVFPILLVGFIFAVASVFLILTSIMINIYAHNNEKDGGTSCDKYILWLRIIYISAFAVESILFVSFFLTNVANV